MSQPDTEEILEVCGKVGEIMLNAGAETSRIETTVEYIGHAAGAKVACYATITAVFVSLENESRTRLIKSSLGGFNLQKVDELNQLSREFVAHQITFDALKQEVARIERQVINFPWWARILALAGCRWRRCCFLKRPMATWLGLFLSGSLVILRLSWLPGKRRRLILKKQQVRLWWPF